MAELIFLMYEGSNTATLYESEREAIEERDYTLITRTKMGDDFFLDATGQLPRRIKLYKVQVEEI
jgi:hypothetical protein